MLDVLHMTDKKIFIENIKSSNEITAYYVNQKKKEGKLKMDFVSLRIAYNNCREEEKNKIIHPKEFLVACHS